MESTARSAEERRYVHLAPETVTNIAESLGISNLSAGVAKELAEDVTYRLRDIADVCSQFLRHSRYITTFKLSLRIPLFFPFFVIN